MEFTHYQSEALKTAKPTALDLDYLLPGLIAEVGECYGKVAKAIRDEWPTERLNEELEKEWGDVAWFVAVALDALGVHDDEDVDDPVDFPTRNDALESALECATISAQTSRGCRYLQETWATLRDGSEVVTGQPFNLILATNLAKLADRANRGVVGGSGDAR